MKHGYLLYTGYGKTKLCLDMIIRMVPVPRVLLISTRNIIESSWQSEIDKWYPGRITYRYLTGHVPVTERSDILNGTSNIFGINTEMLQWFIENTCSIKSKRMYKNEVRITYNTTDLLKRFDMVIIDESSLFKNAGAERFKLIKGFVPKMEHVVILSATPTPKNIEDLWAQIYLLDGGERLGTSLTKFRNEYAIPVPLPNGMNRYEYTQKAIDHILNLVRDIVTSIPAPEQPLFPEPIINKVLVQPDKETEKTLQHFRKEFVLKLPDKQQMIAFSQNQLMNKINQVVNGSVYHKDLTYHLNDIKFQLLKHTLQYKTTPVAIIYLHRFTKEQLLTLPGARMLDNKEAFEDWNNNKIPVGILSPYSASHGLNLQHSNARDVVWYSPIWDTEKWIQTNARFARRGQKHQLTITVLLMKHSYEQYAFELCQDKYRIQYNALKTLS